MSPTTTTATTTTHHPHEEYELRRRSNEERVLALARHDRRLSTIRLVTFLLIALAAWLAWGPRNASPLLVVALAVVFVALLLYHERVVAALQRSRRALDLYVRGLDRLAGRWHDHGARGERFIDSHHPYAADLDLFGDASLYQLLCRARTRAGEERLASWLSAPASPAEVAARQEAVRELSTMIDLREDLALLGDDVSDAVDVEILDRWGSSTARAFSPRTRWVALFIAGLPLCGVIAWAAGLGTTFLVAALLVASLFAAYHHAHVENALAAVERPARELALLSALLTRIESTPFRAPRLVALQAHLGGSGHRASVEIARLHRLISLADSRRNQMFAPIAMLLLWGTQFAMAIEHWRMRCGPSLALWVNTIGEVEALASLAWHGYEHPSDPFPQLVESPPSFAARGVKHPLLVEDTAVANDLELGHDAHLLVVSGSNMSGKSTLLRAVGCNIVLALAGAPVRCATLRLTPFQLGASIRVQDSLREGTSRFYAEIKRLRQIVELTTGNLPLLFLFDEILNGTNSHDRRLGAAAVVRTLVVSGALGLVTTHDLALAKIADDPGMKCRNVHFEDQLVGDRIQFDYQLREGVVQRSNAIALMRAIGLKV